MCKCSQNRMHRVETETGGGFRLIAQRRKIAFYIFVCVPWNNRRLCNLASFASVQHLIASHTLSHFYPHRNSNSRRRMDLRSANTLLSMSNTRICQSPNPNNTTRATKTRTNTVLVLKFKLPAHRSWYEWSVWCQFRDGFMYATIVLRTSIFNALLIQSANTCL